MPANGDWRAIVIKVPPADQASIVMNSAQHMDTRLRHQRPQGVKIGLAVGHDRHRLGILKHTLAGIGGFDPAARFFLIKRPFAVRYADPAGAGPDLASNQAQASLGLGVHCHHGMQQRATPHAFANLTQTAGARFGRAKIDLAGVLDRQHMPAGNRRAGGRAPPRNQPLDGHFAVGEKAIELDLQLPFAISHSTQTCAARTHHPFEERRPLFRGDDPQSTPAPSP